MQANQPFQLSQILPAGMSTDDFYVALSAVAAFFCVWAIGTSFATRERSIQRKIKIIQERRRELQSGVRTPKQRKKPEASVNFMRAVVTKFHIIKKLQVDKAENTLIEAGLRSKDAIFILAFFNFVLPIALCIVGFLIMHVIGDVRPKWKMMHIAAPLLGAYLGLKLPWLYIRRVRKKRYAEIQKALPDVLDLMTICAEAGLSLAMMLDRVSRELALAYPEMAEELSLTSIEIGFLPDRNKALSNLATRCTLPEVRGLVSVLIQTEKYGTPIAQAMRVLSTEFRQARMLRAEQKAARLPALMTVPMIVFILPTLFIVIISPAIIKLMDTLK
jgi:tight adherence protein C